MKGDLTPLNSEESNLLRDYLTKAQKLENGSHKAKEKIFSRKQVEIRIQVTSMDFNEIISSANVEKPIASDRVKVHYTENN